MPASQVFFHWTLLDPKDDFLTIVFFTISATVSRGSETGFFRLPFEIREDSRQSGQQEFQQGLLRVQPVFRFLPDYALRPIDHLGGHFLAAVSRQAVHE